jgi:hypothetical protein
MCFSRTILAILSLALIRIPTLASDTPPTQEQLRQAVERSLVFLENSAADWKNGNNGVGADHGHAIFVKGTQAACASCHHVPMTVRCMTEAKNHGFKVNDDTVDDFRQWSLWPYLQDPDLTPFNQDKFGKATTSLNTIYLSEALFPANTRDEQATEALKKFATHLIARQEADGSWKSGRSGYEPPIGDSSDVLTMQALLVLSSAAQRGLAGDGWDAARDRALAWLRKNKPDESNQALNMQTQLAQRFGQPRDVAPLVEELRKLQNADGGWSQLKDRPSDALATGQTLYVLALAGADAQDPAVQRGQVFLTQTQLKDGSWWIPSRDKGRKGLAISHYGSGWATLGLIQTLKNVN